MTAKNNSILTFKDYKCYYVSDDDLDSVRDYLTKERNNLERIEFFFPYTDEELQQVVSGGHFLVATKDGNIVGSLALDLDKNYAKLIADRVSECTLKNINPEFAYEVSGLMVSSSQRGQGLASALLVEILNEAKRMKLEYVCSVVQLENIASMKTFLNKGFVLAGVYQQGGDYDFGYFIKNINAEFSIDYADTKLVKFRDVLEHFNSLKTGYVGVKLLNDCVQYARLKKYIS